MPERGHRFYGTEQVRVATVIEAPLAYVYGWCTDYRPSDRRLSRAQVRPRFRVLRLSPRRLLRIRTTPTRSGEPLVAVDVVRLHPPAAWHTDQIDETDRESVDYRLRRLGPRRTRLDLLVTERWLTPEFPTRGELRDRVRTVWQRYKLAIEADYRAGRPAIG